MPLILIIVSAFVLYGQESFYRLRGRNSRGSDPGHYGRRKVPTFIQDKPCFLARSPLRMPIMRDFIHESFAGRVVFGPGRIAELPTEIELLGKSSVMVVSTRSRAAEAASVIAELGNLCKAHVPESVMHVPRDRVVAAVAEAERCRADCIVAIGGGSATGLAKAVRLERDVAIVAVPSTYAGSEMTDIWGISEAEGKVTGRDERVVPSVVIYDPDLTRTLPGPIAGPSGLNAIAHSVEALYALNRNPVLSMIAEEGIRRMAGSLPAVCQGVSEEGDREEALYGAFLCGLALAKATMGLHHKLCHVLGGTFGLPHAETHAVILPYVARYNANAAPEAMAATASALGASSAPTGLRHLAAEIGAPLSLSVLGLGEENLDAVADIATEAPYFNPRPVERDSLRALLDDACFGRFSTDLT